MDAFGVVDDDVVLPLETRRLFHVGVRIAAIGLRVDVVTVAMQHVPRLVAHHAIHLDAGDPLEHPYVVFGRRIERPGWRPRCVGHVRAPSSSVHQLFLEVLDPSVNRLVTRAQRWFSSHDESVRRSFPEVRPVGTAERASRLDPIGQRLARCWRHSGGRNAGDWLYRPTPGSTDRIRGRTPAIARWNRQWTTERRWDETFVSRGSRRVIPGQLVRPLGFEPRTCGLRVPKKVSISCWCIH